MRVPPALCALLASVAVPSAAAVAYLAASDWFGFRDLAVFLYWTLPFAVLAALVGHRLHGWFGARRRWQRFLLAGALGLLLGLCWTLAVSLALGGWIAAFSIPVLHLWALAGASSLLVFAATSPSRASSYPRGDGRPTRRKLAWVLGVPTAAAGLALILIWVPLLGGVYLWDRAEAELHLIPDGFTGPVVIIFNQPDGAPIRRDGRARVYEIPTSGVLRSQFGPNPGWLRPRYVYAGSQGEDTPILSGTPCDRDLPPRTIQACLMGRMWLNGSSPEYSAYVVGPTAAIPELYHRGDSLVRASVFGAEP